MVDDPGRAGGSAPSAAHLGPPVPYPGVTCADMQETAPALHVRIQKQLERRAQRGIRRHLTRRDPPTSPSGKASEAAGGPLAGVSEGRAGEDRRPKQATTTTTASAAAAAAASVHPTWVDFSSNDYLSFATSAELKATYLANLHSWSERHPSHPLTSSTGSRLLDGNLALSEEVERACAAHFCSPDALLFNTGFAANATLLGFLPAQGDIILYDELIHASMHDGLRRSRARAFPFQHSDPASLRKLVTEVVLPHLDQSRPSGRNSQNEWDPAPSQLQAASSSTTSVEPTVFIAVEGVYSMDGDLCPLPSMLDVLQLIPKRQRCLIVDEAHSAGVYGPQGKGLSVGWHVQSQVDIRLVTFGKALGASGAVLLCHTHVKDFLLNYGRALIYSTALPPTVLIAMLGALEALQSPLHTLAQRQVLDLGHKLRHALGVSTCRGVQEARSAVFSPHAGQGSSVRPEAPHISLTMGSPIVPVLEREAKSLAAFLQSEGLVVRGITYPTVPRGQNRVRICLHAGNSAAQVEWLIRRLRAWRGPGGELSHCGSHAVGTGHTRHSGLDLPKLPPSGPGVSSGLGSNPSTATTRPTPSPAGTSAPTCPPWVSPSPQLQEQQPSLATDPSARALGELKIHDRQSNLHRLACQYPHPHPHSHQHQNEQDHTQDRCQCQIQIRPLAPHNAHDAYSPPTYEEPIPQPREAPFSKL